VERREFAWGISGAISFIDAASDDADFKAKGSE
jgi:hypothetical protein